MINRISFSEFSDAFRDMNRENNFTYEGKRALFDYLEELEEEMDKEIELDVIALCVEYSEYKDLNEFLEDYDYSDLQKEAEETSMSDEDFKEAVEERISENTTLIKLRDDLDDGFIIRCY